MNFLFSFLIRLKGLVLTVCLRLVKHVWFSPVQREFILPFLNSRLSSYLLLDSGNFLGKNRQDSPSRNQRLFQKLFLTAMRSPEGFIKNFQNTLRVCITYQCNLSCDACYAQGLKAEIPGDMGLASFSRLISWAKERGWKKIRLLGGEPTIHPDFTELLDICYRNEMMVTLPTNNLFSERVMDKLDSPLIKDVSINYSASSMLSEEDRIVFLRNIAMLSGRNIPFGFSHVLEYRNNADEWGSLFDDAERFRPNYIRASIRLPSFPDETFCFRNTREISLEGKIRQMWKKSAMMWIPFFVYRPVPLCMFKQLSRHQEGYPSNLFFSCCPLSYHSQECGYGTMITVNPDLSTFPCASVFVRGPSIFTFTSKQEIGRYYDSRIKALLTKPLMDECRDCSFHKNFIRTVTREEDKDEAIFKDRNICQGGCMSFRCHTGASFHCKE